MAAAEAAAPVEVCGDNGQGVRARDVLSILKADLSRVQMRGLTSKHEQLALLYALVQAACSVPLPEFTVACCALWNSYACDDNGGRVKVEQTVVLCSV